MRIDDITLRELRRYIGVGYCRLRQTHLGCRFRQDVENMKPDDKIPFGCEDCLSECLTKKHEHADKAATLIQYTTWHYMSLITKMHGDLIDKMDFIKWKLRVAKIDSAYSDEIGFIMKAATDEIIEKRLTKERKRIDREARKAEKETEENHGTK